jgi:hypothetical protein
MKVAVTVWSELIVTVHVVVPAHAPPQPAKVEPVAAIALKDTAVPSAYPFEHVPGQEIPEPDTVPEPEPVSETVRVCVGIVVNVAVTF